MRVEVVLTASMGFRGEARRPGTVLLAGETAEKILLADIEKAIAAGCCTVRAAQPAPEPAAQTVTVGAVEVSTRADEPKPNGRSRRS